MDHSHSCDCRAQNKLGSHQSELIRFLLKGHPIHLDKTKERRKITLIPSENQKITKKTMNIISAEVFPSKMRGEKKEVNIDTFRNFTFTSKRLGNQMARNVKIQLTLKDKIIEYIVNEKYGIRIFSDN